jgi:hypothetical protein
MDREALRLGRPGAVMRVLKGRTLVAGAIALALGGCGWLVGDRPFDVIDAAAAPDATQGADALLVEEASSPEDHAPADDVTSADVPGVDVAVDVDVDVGVPCDQVPIDAGPPTVCSMSVTAEAGLVVVNPCLTPIDLWWVNYECAEVFYATIQGQSHLDQASYATHVWRLRLADAGALIKEIPPLPPGVTTVSASGP